MRSKKKSHLLAAISPTTARLEFNEFMVDHPWKAINDGRCCCQKEILVVYFCPTETSKSTERDFL